MLNTRSQTARSRPPNKPSLTTLGEEVRDLNVEDGRTSLPRRPTQLSPDYEPVDERREAEGIETHTTPRTRKKSIASSPRNLARDADPNNGRCLVTNLPDPVLSCHLVAQATNHETLTKFEYVWGLKYKDFNIDMRYNTMHLRNDWQFFFDQPNTQLRCCLRPLLEGEVLPRLSKIYVEDGCTTSDIARIFAEPTYRYYVLPALTLEESMCRYPDVNKRDHETHFPPYSTLGPLTSHIHLHFVIFNAAWMGVPDHFYDTIGTPNKFHRLSDEGRDDHSQGGPPRCQGLRSATRSQGQGTQVSAGYYEGGQKRAIHPLQPPDDVTLYDTAWIKYIHNWKKQDEDVVGSWELDVLHDLCDEQLAAYINEHACTPPSPGAWIAGNQPGMITNRDILLVCLTGRSFRAMTG
ncbi:hypothetical protein HD554DRAFT_2272926 [Boletus coccyginus]|nr:hypothetical protein HD554DRAFT_2272926 [Boletus coccyginus]